MSDDKVMMILTMDQVTVIHAIAFEQTEEVTSLHIYGREAEHGTVEVEVFGGVDDSLLYECKVTINGGRKYNR